MQDGNIPGGAGISPESFDINLNVLDGPQVDQPPTPGSTPQDQPPRVEIDPKYQGLPEAEAIARTIQSKYDKLNMDFINAQKEVQSLMGYKDVVNDLYGNDDALYAFLSERKPELISSRDIKTEVTKRLADKGYKEYEPQFSRDEAERKDPGGKDWLYYRELDKITSEITGTGQYAKHKTLKEFQQARLTEIQAEDAKIELEISEAKEKLKMPDAEVEWNRKFAATVKFEDIVKITRFLRKFQNAPTMGNIPGNQTFAGSKTRQEFVNSLK